MNLLHERIRRLPPGVEFLVVITWAFGLPIFGSILSIGGAGSSESGGPATRLQFSNASLIATLVMELTQSLFLIWFLKIRGWTLEKLGLQVTWRGTLMGSTLLAVAILMLIVVMKLAELVSPLDMQAAVARYPAPAPDLNMQLVFIVSTANGIFEEAFVAGYIITALSAVRGIWTGINVSTGVRLLCHLYQGPIGVLATVPLGLLFGYFYARTRMLWPLVFAHILMDIIGLGYRASGS
jgi:membrane protease YdiL (CAAX protease family)